MAPGAAHPSLEALQREAEAALEAKDYRHAHELCMAILAQEPLYADAYFLLAMIAAEHAQFGKALDVIGRALKVDAQRADFHAQRARFLLALTQPRPATEAALQALSLQPQDAFTFDTIGVVLTRAGAQLEAIEPFRQATRLAPERAAYRYNLAAALQFAGDFSGAEAEYRAALRLEPRMHRAWSALAQLRRCALSPADVNFLEQLLTDETLDADAELHVRHAFAKHCEDEQAYEQAFAHLETGKRRKRATLQYSIERDIELFAAIRDVCTPQFCGALVRGEPFDCTQGRPVEPLTDDSQNPSTLLRANEKGRAPGFSSDEPIFIVGMPRTGTTLVERILSSHPKVFAAGELTHFSLAVKRAAGTSSPYVLDRETLEAASGLNFHDIGRDYIDSTRPRTGHTRHFIDKMPLNFLYAGFIHRALPQARIICVRRNALDTCLSNYRQLFATSFSYYNYAYDLLDTGRYYKQFDALMAYWREILPADRFMEVRYEDVVIDTEREARRLLEFCGLSFTPEVLAFHKNSAPVSTASSVQVRQPIYRTSVERWRKYEKQIAPLIELLSSG